MVVSASAAGYFIWERKPRVSTCGLINPPDTLVMPGNSSEAIRESVSFCVYNITVIIIIIMYIYHALINALSAHIIHINLSMIFYTHVEQSPAKTIYIK